MHLGDTVIVPGGFKGTVVADIDAGEFSNSYTRADWDYLKTGILVETQEGGLLHVEASDLTPVPR